MTFLPDNYQPPAASGGNYTKLAQGKTTIRILGDAIIGYLGWGEEAGKRKPYRSKDLPPAGTFEEKAKHFWAFPVWNHSANSMQILEITQKGIQGALVELYRDDSWGDPQRYDIVITREGENLETSYTVMPKMPSELSGAALAIINDALPKLNIEALYTGDDPFAAMESQQTNDNDPFGTTA